MIRAQSFVAQTASVSVLPGSVIKKRIVWMVQMKSVVDLVQVASSAAKMDDVFLNHKSVINITTAATVLMKQLASHGKAVRVELIPTVVPTTNVCPTITCVIETTIVETALTRKGVEIVVENARRQKILLFLAKS